jgi:AAHS family 4-hydroxybenzoate transporter-like MFS transporter
MWMTMTGTGEKIEIERLIDGQKIGRLNIMVLVLSFLIMVSDGYDLKAAAFSAPFVIRDWGIDRAALGPVFSACPLGMLIGAPLLGQLGDRLGRRRVLVLGSLIYGVFTLATAASATIEQMALFRFLTGIGLGGILPNIVALNAEFAPARVRATMIVLVLMGITLGDAVPAAITALFVESMGWQIIYIVGGLLGLGTGLAAWFLMPESIKFLAARGAPQEQLVASARRIRPDLTIPDDAQLVLTEPPARKTLSPSVLFLTGLGLVTLSLWLTNASNLMVNYFLSSWMPTLFHDAGLSVDEMALTSSMYYVGAICGGLLVSRLIDRWGGGMIIVLFLLACPAVLLIGSPGLPHALLMGAVFLSGFSILGAQMAINATSGLIYPTSIRAKGVGWSNSVGRLGAILGPLLGGWLLAQGLSTQQFFQAAVAPLLVGAGASYVLLRTLRTRRARNAT